jgi:YesN/AraC family two-component response regulator
MKNAVSIRLLVIDDDNLVRAALTDMLQTAGFEVVTASNGRLGLELLDTTPVDAIITDILMPEQEGLETIREARQRFPEIRILAISGGGRRRR